MGEANSDGDEMWWRLPEEVDICHGAGAIDRKNWGFSDHECKKGSRSRNPMMLTTYIGYSAFCTPAKAVVLGADIRKQAVSLVLGTVSHSGQQSSRRMTFRVKLARVTSRLVPTTSYKQSAQLDSCSEYTYTCFRHHSPHCPSSGARFSRGKGKRENLIE